MDDVQNITPQEMLQKTKQIFDKIMSVKKVKKGKENEQVNFPIS